MLAEGRSANEHYEKRKEGTHHFGQELAQDADKLIVDKLATFQTRLLQSLDLLFNDNFESGGADEERWSRTLRT